MEKTAGRALRALVVPKVRGIDIAREAGVNSQYVYQVLNGQRPPSEKILAAAERLGLPIDDLYGTTAERRARKTRQ